MVPSSKRPERIRITDQLGREKSLPDGSDQYRLLSTGAGTDGVLLLGMGPGAGSAAAVINDSTADVIYLEAPEFARQMPRRWSEDIPDGWQSITVADLSDPAHLRRKVVFYQPNLRLFPDFWAPVLAVLRMRQAPSPVTRERDTVWMPTSGHKLLLPELTQAFTAAGLQVQGLPDPLSPADLSQRLHQSRPGLFFSVNFSGLDPYGENHELLAARGVPVAVWCVDNPFHLLTAAQSGFWRKCVLFVTDDWFIAPLLAHGANTVLHLPLAAAPHFFSAHDRTPWTEDTADSVAGHGGGSTKLPTVPDHDLQDRTVFVGRSSFPDKKTFFAGCRMPAHINKQALALMRHGGRPDFSWWWQRLSKGFRTPLWPGRAVRGVGYAAEQCSQMHRIMHLHAAHLGARLTIFGDREWSVLLPELNEIRPMVDYYGPLADIYRQARYTLNLTSLLLPHGLTQRHFDVWAAGGFLLSDTTPGLSIFDPQLIKEITFTSPATLLELIHRLDGQSNLIHDLRRAWQIHIREAHTYERRIHRIIASLKL